MKDVIAPPHKMAYRRRASRAASDPSAGVGSGKRNMLTVSPTPSGSLVYNIRSNIMTATVWGVIGALKRIFSAVRQHAASMAACALSLDISAIMIQIWGRSFTAVTLQSYMRLRRSSPHISAGPVGGFKVAGGSTTTCGIGVYLICGCMGVGGGVGMRALRIY